MNHDSGTYAASKIVDRQAIVYICTNDDNIVNSPAFLQPAMTSEILYETFDLTSSTTILGLLYGIAFTLYCLCSRLLCLQLSVPDKRKQARFNLVYISLVLICGTTYLALVTRFMQLAYINHANDPEGPRGFKVSYNSTTEIFGVGIGIFDLAVETLTMAIQVGY